MNDPLCHIHGSRRISNSGGGAVNFLLERSKRSGEEPKKLHEFPIVLSEKLPE